MDGLRSTQQQLSDEFLADYRRMTDPEERRKDKVKKRRAQFAQEMQEDTGL